MSYDQTACSNKEFSHTYTPDMVSKHLLKRSSLPVESSLQVQLITKIANEQCETSFRQLFDFYSPKIFQYARTYQLDDASAMDLVQEVMAVLWRKSYLFDSSKGQVSTWIFTIARNLRFDLMRKKKKEAHVLSSDDLWNEADASGALELESSLERKHLSQEVVLKVDSLPQAQREVLHSIYVMGLTHEEYSAQSGIPLGTVKSRLRLALAKLTRLMG